MLDSKSSTPCSINEPIHFFSGNTALEEKCRQIFKDFNEEKWNTCPPKDRDPSPQPVMPAKEEEKQVDIARKQEISPPIVSGGSLATTIKITQDLSITTTLLVDESFPTLESAYSMTSSRNQSGKTRRQSDKSTSPPLDLKRTALPKDERPSA